MLGIQMFSIGTLLIGILVNVVIISVTLGDIKDLLQNKKEVR